jgi:hypothetical protein
MITDKLEKFPEVSLSQMEADLNSEFLNLESGYNTRKANRIEAWKRYNFEPYGNEADGASKMTDSSIFNVVEWMVPSLIQPFIETQDFIKVIPESAKIKDIIAAEYNRELLNFQMRKRMDLYSIYYDTFKTFLVGGDSFIKLTWVKRSKKTGEPVGRPNLTPTSPDSIRYDWTVKGGFMKSRVVTHEEDWTRSEVLDMKGMDGVIQSQLDKVLLDEGQGMKTSRLEDEQIVDKNYIGNQFHKADKNKSLFLRREHWTTYDMDGTGKLIPVMAVFINNCLVQVIKNPYDFQRPPFVNAECVRDPQGNPAAGWANILGDIQGFRTSILRMMSDNLNSQLNGIYEVDQTNVDDIGFQLLMNAPAGSRIGIPTRRPGSITPLPTNPLAPQAMTAWQLMEDAGENRGGFPRYAQGLNPSSLSQTATGVVETTQRAEMRLWELATRFGESTLKPLIRMIISLNQQMLEPQDIEVQFGIDARGQSVFDPDTGEEISLDAHPRDLIKVHKDDISGYFSVNLDIQVGSDKQNQINNMMQYAQYFGSIEAIPPEVTQVVAVETARLMGIPKVEAIMRRDYVGGGNTAVPDTARPAAEAGATSGGLQAPAGATSVPGIDNGGLPGEIGAPEGPIS